MPTTAALLATAPAEARRLEEAAADQPMEARLLQAAARVERAGAPAPSSAPAPSPAPTPAPAPLRAEQARVFAAFATYLEDLATRPRSRGASTPPPFVTFRGSPS